MKIVIIAAVSRNGYIGKDGKLPWSIPEELKHFYNSIDSKALICGSRTFRSLPKKLQNYQPLFLISGEYGHTFSNAIKSGKEWGFKELYVIGGAYVYSQAIPLADELIISYVHDNVSGDTKMPEIPYSKFKVIRVKKNEKFTTIWWKRKDVPISKKSAQ